MATSQCKWAIERLKEAGFKRSEFSCRTEITKITIGDKTYSEYGGVNVYIKANKSRQLDLADKLAKNFRVTVFRLENGSLSRPFVEYASGNGLFYCDLKEKDKHGFNVYHKINSISEV